MDTKEKLVFTVILVNDYCSLGSLRERERWLSNNGLCVLIIQSKKKKKTMVYVAGKTSMHEDLLSLELQYLYANEERSVG